MNATLDWSTRVEHARLEDVRRGGRRLRRLRLRACGRRRHRRRRLGPSGPLQEQLVEHLSFSDDGIC